MEAYLNTIFLGFNSYGIQAASQAYFSKDTQDLTTLECAALAALPQSPDSYALVKTDYNGSGSTSGLPVISSTDSVTYLYNGDISETRRNAVINNMAEEGYISSEERDNLLSENLADHIKIGVSADADESSYFTCLLYTSHPGRCSYSQNLRLSRSYPKRPSAEHSYFRKTMSSDSSPLFLRRPPPSALYLHIFQAELQSFHRKHN